MKHTQPPNGEFRSQNGPRTGMEWQGSNATPLTVLKGKLTVACETCGLQFKRHHSQLAKYAHHYCSKSCFGLAARRRVASTCCVCERALVVTPWTAAHPTSCSPECDDLRRRLRRHHDKTGLYSEARRLRDEGNTLEAVAEKLGYGAKQSAAYLLRKETEHATLLSAVEERRRIASNAEPINRHIR